MVSQGIALAKSAQELLEDYVRTGSQAPFEEVVRRYAGMVFNVCYQVLKDSHDAEDATQAVFLALAVQAKTANGVKYLAPWLQKVAQRLSLDVRRSKTRRKAREERHSYMRLQMGIENDPTKQPGMDELKIILRDELDKLPSKYRMPLVLHYFGGLKPEEISRELGCKPSTLGVRLHRGRKMLADLLSERGIVVNGSMLTIALAACVQCRISETLIHSTAHAAGAYAAQGTFAAAVTPQVFGFNRMASHGIMLAKVKAAVTAGILAAAAAAGAAELVSRVAPDSWRFNLRTEFQQWLKPSFEDLLPKLRVDSGAVSANAVAMNASEDFINFNFPQTMMRAVDISPTPVFNSPAPIAVAFASVPSSNDPRDTPYGESASESSSDSEGGSFLLPPVQSSAKVAKTDAFRVTADVSYASSSGSAGRGGASGAAGSLHVLPPPPPVQTITRNTPGTPFGPGHLPPQPFVPKNSDSVALGKAQGDDDNLIYSKPGRVSTNQLNVGESGNATLTIASGTFSVQDNLELGGNLSGRGAITLRNSAALYVPTIDVGGDGRGELTIEDRATVSANSITIGKNGSGSLRLEDGSINSKAMYVGKHNHGVVNQTGGTVTLSGFLGNVGALQLGVSANSEGIYYHQGGNLSAGLQMVGMRGHGHIRQIDGLNSAISVVLGDERGGLGSYQLHGGTLQFNRSDAGSPVANQLTVGNAGRGLVILGSDDSSGTLTEIGNGKGTDLIVRGNASGEGQVIGYGRPLLTGMLDQSGQVIADGFGQSRTLDLSSFAVILNSIDNQPGEQNGWYARDGGRLVLPLNRASQAGSLLIDSYSFGEELADTEIDLVNSVRFEFDPKLDDSIPVMVSLLSQGNDAVPEIPEDQSFTTIYGTNFSSLPTGSVELTIRYDAVSIGDNTPRLLAYTINGWENVASSDLAIDRANHLIVATTTPSNFYAIVVPEPVSGSVLVIGAAMLLTRRRRQF